MTDSAWRGNWRDLLAADNTNYRALAIARAGGEGSVRAVSPRTSSRDDAGCPARHARTPPPPPCTRHGSTRVGSKTGAADSGPTATPARRAARRASGWTRRKHWRELAAPRSRASSPWRAARCPRLAPGRRAVRHRGAGAATVGRPLERFCLHAGVVVLLPGSAGGSSRCAGTHGGHDVLSSMV
jgi:hypothetical protein